MDKNNFFLDSPNLTDLVQVLINNICSEKIFNVNPKLVLKKYDKSIKKIGQNIISLPRDTWRQANACLALSSPHHDQAIQEIVVVDR